MDDHSLRPAPNYTNACIVMFGVNLIWVLVLIWAVWGLVAAIVFGCGVNVVLDRVSVWKARHALASIRRGKSD